LQADTVIRLRTLGSPLVESDGRPPGSAATQRKPLALLALLAVAGERGESRDKLLAYLWAEIPGDRAAHRLNQLLYALRRDLGEESLFKGTSKLRLNPEVVTSDRGEFIGAHRRGELERAVAAYSGPFLDGFHLRGAAEFDRWLEGERASLGRCYQESLEALAAAAAAAGDRDRATAWLHRLAEHDPLSSRVIINLMGVLAASGRRADALRTARAYQERVQEELEAAPSPAVMALAEELRRRPAAKSDAVAIAVLPLAIVGADAKLADFAAGLMEELMQVFGREPGLRVVARTSVQGVAAQGLDARALGQRLGAGAILESSVRQAGTQIRLVVTLVDALDGCRIWSETLEREVEDGFGTEDALARLVIEGVRLAIAGLRNREGKA
jgi:DNA-binding SARP family transcriptional activator